jgi:hypothetical protein
VYGKPIPNTRVDTSELADRVSTITFLEIIRLKGPPNIDRRTASATLSDPVLMKEGDSWLDIVTGKWADDCTYPPMSS